MSLASHSTLLSYRSTEDAQVRGRTLTGASLRRCCALMNPSSHFYPIPVEPRYQVQQRQILSLLRKELVSRHHPKFLNVHSSAGISQW
jgi:hypothetical protein